MLMMEKDTWDVIVVGGGPAGMMTAGRAAELGARVLLLEKNDTLGKKLLITGGGRCNVTNAEFDTRALLEKFNDAGKFLFSAFAQWDSKDTINFFNTRGMDTKIEKEKRVFPTSDKAQSVWDVLVEYVRGEGGGSGARSSAAGMRGSVTVRSNTTVTDMLLEDGQVVGVTIKGREQIRAKAVVIATGGTSRPETGSTGDAYAWLSSIGHTIIEPTPSLVPIATRSAWTQRLSGVSVPDIKITMLQNNEKQDVRRGKILFTHVGLSGPTILNMSKDVGELLKYGDVVISLDLLPTLDYGTLNTKLQEIFKKHANKKFKNSLSGEDGLIFSALAPIVIELSGINPETPCNSITREERLKLITLLKDIRIDVDHLLGVEKAIITSGGVLLDEIDFKTMRSRLFPNLYIVGDMLNIDRPSGGYSLQLCWTTGFVAGSNVTNQTSN